jgi:hypothetical protein
MRYVTPLERRRKAAERRKERYRRDEAYRLARINETRSQRGLRPIMCLSEMGDRFAGRPNAPRDEQGRFA